jgi:hypothetical protein
VDKENIHDSGQEIRGKRKRNYSIRGEPRRNGTVRKTEVL